MVAKFTKFRIFEKWLEFHYAKMRFPISYHRLREDGRDSIRTYGKVEFTIESVRPNACVVDSPEPQQRSN